MPHGIIEMSNYMRIRTIRDEVKRFSAKHEMRLHAHLNTAMLQLLNNTNLKRRLKRAKPFEFV